MYNRRLVNKYDENDYFVIVVKTDNLGVGSTPNNAFSLSGAIGRYRVEAKNLSTNNIQRFGTTNGASTLIFSEGAGTYELKIKPRKGTTEYARLNRVSFGTFGDAPKLLEIKQWGSIIWTNGTKFENCINMDVTATDIPNFTQITSIASFFRGCSSLQYNSSIQNWNTENITNFSYLFNGATLFNQDISTWNTTSLVDMAHIFSAAITFNQNIDGWDVSSVTDINHAFNNATSFQQSLNSWDTSSVTNMTATFANCNYNGNISNWNTSSVTSMSLMFYFNSNFNQDISTKSVTVGSNTYTAWDVSSVQNFSEMFRGSASSVFNQNIGNWNTSSAVNMFRMFRNATSFNQDISTKSVTVGANTYTAWNVTSVTNMGDMFRVATNFNQSIANWNVINVTNFTNFMEGKTASNYSTTNLDAIYNTWSAITVKPNINISFGSIKYTIAGQPGKNILLNSPNNWTITDGGI